MSQAAGRVLSKLLQAFFIDTNRVSSLWANLEGILQCVSKAKRLNVKGSIIKHAHVFVWVCTCKCLRLIWAPNRWRGDKACWCVMYHCLPPYPLKHICSHTQTARQSRRDPQCPCRERVVCCLTVCQQAQINSVASSPQSLSSLLLTSETFSLHRPCDLSLPESFTQPAMLCCVLKGAVTNSVAYFAETVTCHAMPAHIHILFKQQIHT